MHPKRKLFFASRRLIDIYYFRCNISLELENYVVLNKSLMNKNFSNLIRLHENVHIYIYIDITFIFADADNSGNVIKCIKSETLSDFLQTFIYHFRFITFIVQNKKNMFTETVSLRSIFDRVI